MRCVLFDLDGTLIDTWWLYVESYRRTLHSHYGRHITVEEIAALKPTSERQLLRHAVGVAAEEQFYRAFLDHYKTLHDTHYEGVYAGVLELLSALRARGLRLGLVTGKSRAAWEITAEYCGLGAFETVVTDEDVQAPKPHPDGLQQALRRLAVPPAEALYVGDSLADLGAAQAAGVAFVGVLWCKAPEEREAFRAEALGRGALGCIENPQALLGVLTTDRAEAR